MKCEVDCWAGNDKGITYVIFPRLLKHESYGAEHHADIGLADSTIGEFSWG